MPADASLMTQMFNLLVLVAFCVLLIIGANRIG
jgi:hypothetical protein